MSREPTLHSLDAKLDALADDVREVKELAGQTNGRVRHLELWRARMEGVRLAVSWVPAFLTAMAGAGIGSAVMLLVH